MDTTAGGSTFLPLLQVGRIEWIVSCYLIALWDRIGRKSVGESGSDRRFGFVDHRIREIGSGKECSCLSIRCDCGFCLIGVRARRRADKIIRRICGYSENRIVCGWCDLITEFILIIIVFRNTGKGVGPCTVFRRKFRGDGESFYIFRIALTGKLDGNCFRGKRSQSICIFFGRILPGDRSLNGNGLRIYRGIRIKILDQRGTGIFCRRNYMVVYIKIVKQMRGVTDPFIRIRLNIDTLWFKGTDDFIPGTDMIAVRVGCNIELKIAFVYTAGAQIGNYRIFLTGRSNDAGTVRISAVGTIGIIAVFSGVHHTELSVTFEQDRIAVGIEGQKMNRAGISRGCSGKRFGGYRNSGEKETHGAYQKQPCKNLFF